MRYYKQRRLYRSPLGTSANIMDILPKSLTLYPMLNPAIWRESGSHEYKTIFQEVDIVPFDEANPDAVELLKPLEAIKPELVSEKEYVILLWEELKRAMMDCYRSGAKTFVYSSSGHDSRLLALLLNELLFDVDLGDLYFVEGEAEGVQFRKNMSILEWKQDLALVYNENTPIHEHYADALDFETAWLKLGGMSGSPVSFMWQIQDWLDSIDMIPNPENTQFILGYFSNEITRMVKIGRSIYEFWRRRYIRNMSVPVPKLVEEDRPFQYINVMETILRYGKEHLAGEECFSRKVLKHYAPDLADIPTPKLGVKHKTVRLASVDMMERAISDYQSSWFGQKFPDVEPTPVLTYTKWWAHWVAASFCEHLRKSGYTIKIGR